MDWRNIPSLSALRAFEAAARLRNQSAAARELNVTHAAINQHIRSLESFFDLPLFEREGRELRLTKKGQTLYQSVATGFSEIAFGVEETLKKSGDQRLRVSLTPSNYKRWLLPRIQKFWESYPEVHIEFDSSPHLIDLKRDHFDLAVRYGRGNWPPYESEFLHQGKSGIFASQAYLNSRSHIQNDLSKGDWIRSQDSPEFFEIHENYGVDFTDKRHKIFQQNSEARAALVAGMGLLCQDREFLENELKFGLVVEVKRVTLPPELGYYLVTKAGPKSPELRTFIHWLKTEVESSNPNLPTNPKTPISD